MRKHTLLTLDERMALAARGRVPSPAAGAARLIRLKDMNYVKFFMYSDTFDGAYLFSLFEKVDGFDFDERSTYVKLCSDIESLKNTNFHRLYEPLYGAAFSNAVVLLSFILFEAAKEVEKPSQKDLYSVLQLSLGEYIDALIDISVKDNGQVDGLRQGCLQMLKRNSLIRNHLEDPFFEALERILHSFAMSRMYYEHILGIRGYLAGSRNKPIEWNNDSPFPMNRKSLANFYFFDLDRDFKKYDLELYVINAMREPVELLYKLLIEPFLDMHLYHYEKHFDKSL